MKKIILITLALYLIVFVSAAQESLGVFESGICVNLLQTCDNCTYNNITSVTYPNSTYALNDVVMTKDGNEYNYTFCDTNTTGIYSVNGVGDLDGQHTVWSYTLKITREGDDSTPESRTEAITRGVYFIMAISILFFIAFLLARDSAIPIRWTFFILFILFTTVGINIVAISISNHLGESGIRDIFDQVGAVAYYIYWFLGGLLLLIWVITTIATLADRRNMRLAEQVGAPINFQ